MAVFTVIAKASLSLPAATVTFSSIASSYDHLLLKISARSDQVTYVSGMGMKFNEATTNYSETRIVASSLTPVSSRKTGESILRAWGDCAGASVLADTFSTNTVWIPHYANTANFKSFVSKSGMPNNSYTDGYWGLLLGAGLWSDTAAINRIDLSIVTGDDFVALSTFTLYGITGA